MKKNNIEIEEIAQELLSGVFKGIFHCLVINVRGKAIKGTWRWSGHSYVYNVSISNRYAWSEDETRKAIAAALLSIAEHRLGYRNPKYQNLLLTVRNAIGDTKVCNKKGIEGEIYTVFAYHDCRDRYFKIRTEQKLLKRLVERFADDRDYIMFKTTDDQYASLPISGRGRSVRGRYIEKEEFFKMFSFDEILAYQNDEFIQETVGNAIAAYEYDDEEYDWCALKERLKKEAS